MSISNNIRRLLSKLADTANRSEINHRHGAVVMYGGAPVAWGFNSIIGAKTYHAEIAAVKKFLASRGFPNIGKKGYSIL